MTSRTQTALDRLAATLDAWRAQLAAVATRPPSRSPAALKASRANLRAHVDALAKIDPRRTPPVLVTGAFSTETKTRREIAAIRMRLARARLDIRAMTETEADELSIIDAVAEYTAQVVRLRQLEAHAAALTRASATTAERTRAR
jgi:hypothetical protein